MASNSRVRFAFTVRDGTNAGLTCGGWRLWVHGEDVYVTAKSVGGIWKTSLHGDVAWRHAITKEHARSDNPVVPVEFRDQMPWTFTPTPFVDGVRLAFAVAVSRGSLRQEPIDRGEIQIPVADRWDQLTVAYIHMTEPDVDLVPRRRHLAAGPLSLSNGRNVWLSWGTEAVAPLDPEPIPVGAMIEPLWPEKHGVAAPGLMLRGVHIG